MISNFSVPVWRKRNAKENYKRAANEKSREKFKTRWKPTFWTQEPARMADG
jgi:hypothetical protein